MRRDLLDDGLAEELGLDGDDERREASRIAISRRCTLMDPRSRSTARGRTCNVSRTGLLVRLDGRVAVDPGDPVFVGVAEASRRRESPELLPAVVVRVDVRRGGETVLAVRTARTAPALAGVVREAA